MSLGKFLFSLLMPKDNDGSFKFGIRHTGIAALLFGITQVYGLNALYETRRESVLKSAITDSDIKTLNTKYDNLNVLVYTGIQRNTDRFQNIETMFKELKISIQKLEPQKEAHILKHKQQGG